MIRSAVLPWALFALVQCAGCATVDQYGARINDANTNSQNALNDEILLNIVRANRYQSPNFIAISQVTGGQTEALTTGFPSFYVGVHSGNNPLTNGLASTVTGGYQSNPLLSTPFQNGMLSPVTYRTVALLVASHPREAVFSLVLEGFEITLPGGKHAFLNNDPTDDDPKQSGETCDDILRSPGSAPLYPGQQCSFSKFHRLLKGLVANGLYAELTAPSLNSASASTPGSASQTAAASTSGSGAPGRICFNPARAGSKIESLIEKVRHNICGSVQKQPQKEQDTGITRSVSVKQTVAGVETTKADSVTGTLPPQSDGSNEASRNNFLFPYPGVGDIQINFVFRSPDAVIKYLGRWLDARDVKFDYYTEDAKAVLKEEPYLNIIERGSSCYASIIYYGNSYCVPANSVHTAMLMDMVEDLRNINIQPTDLNSAFTVRLAD